jgi:hypothetical protein
MVSGGTAFAQADAMRWCVPLLCVLATGCLNTVLDTVVPPHANGTAPSSVQPPNLPGDVFDTLKAPADAKAELCEADADHPKFPDDADTLTKVLCQDIKPGAPPVKVTSLNVCSRCSVSTSRIATAATVWAATLASPSSATPRR